MKFSHIFLTSIFTLQSFILFAQRAVIDVDVANLRKNSTTDSEIVTQLHKGDTVKILSSLKEWHLIEAGDNKGFIHNDLINVFDIPVEATIPVEEDNGFNLLIILIISVFIGVIVFTERSFHRAKKKKKVEEASKRQEVVDNLNNMLSTVRNEGLEVLKVQNPPIRLKNNERCYVTFNDVIFLEYRTKVKGYGYSGLSVSIPIAKGIRYRIGGGNLNRQTQEELTPIDQGDFYITNKRIIFDGERKNKIITLSSILNLERYEGYMLQVNSGKVKDSFFFTGYDEANELLIEIINHLIEE